MAKLEKLDQTYYDMDDPEEEPASGREESAEIGTSDSVRMTTDHKTIKQWVQRRGGRPIAFRDKPEGTAGLIIDFSNFILSNNLVRLSWKEFFRKFDQAGLVFLYQEETGSGEKSQFNALVDKYALTLDHILDS
jgi:hypothetical protein